MADATVLVSLITAVATLGGSVGGYWLAGRNEEARDRRAADRDDTARRAARAERMDDRLHDTQRQVLCDLQDELQALTRATGKILIQDRQTVKDKGQLFILPNSVSEESFASTVAVQRLCSRVLDHDLRLAVGEFVGFCSRSGIDLLPYKDRPAGELLAYLDNQLADLVTHYQAISAHLGDHVRRELGRT